MKHYCKTILCIVSTLIMGNVHADTVHLETEKKRANIFADFIYWHTSETVDWAFTLQQNSSSFESSFKTFAFDWAPGFRVGLGYNLLHDQWNTQASYTWFQSKASGNTTGEVTPAFFAARLSFLEPFSTGKASINIHYNMFDWDLNRLFFVSQYLFLQPSIGLKCGWINQNIYSYWTKNLLDFFLFTAQENLKQRFFGGGPKGGIIAKWCCKNIHKHSFNLLGKFEAGYLWGHWTIRDNFIDDLFTKISVNTSPRNFNSFMLHGFIGISWDFTFHREQNHFELKIGYEIEDWLNYCQIFTDSSGSQNNDLILQGLDLALSINF